jgi:hypothetical protein
MTVVDRLPRPLPGSLVNDIRMLTLDFLQAFESHVHVIS